MTNLGQIRNSSSTEYKLYQAVLSSCITDFQNFTVSEPKPRRPAAASTPSSFTATPSVYNKLEAKVAPQQPKQPKQADFTSETAPASHTDDAVVTVSSSKPRAEDEISALHSPLRRL
jgi:hypothetical protein